MEFANEFMVAAVPDTTWTLLTDVPKIAPCLPGATVQPAADGEYDGAVTVKVGPVKANYRGRASFTELDVTNYRMVLDARGQEASGKGSAAATVTVRLDPEGPGATRVRVHTALQITGKVAQFGRTAVGDVGERLIAQFSDNLEELLSPDKVNDARPVATDQSSGESSLNAITLVGPVLKRAALPVAAFAAGMTVGVLLKHLPVSPRSLLIPREVTSRVPL